MKIRAFQSQVVFGQGFWRGRLGFLENGHFKNVQNRFTKIKPRIVLFL
jgi:hypothetical protein